MAKASDNQFPSVLFAEQASAPATPAPGLVRLYRDTDGNWYEVDDAGTVTEIGGGSGSSAPLAETIYSPAADTTVATITSTALVDADATNLAVTFTVPASGKVAVELEGLASVNVANAAALWGLREGASAVTLAHGGTVLYVTDVAQALRCRATLLVDGLTGGASKTYKWAAAINSAGQNTKLYAGDVSFGPLTMRVLAR